MLGVDRGSESLLEAQCRGLLLHFCVESSYAFPLPMLGEAASMHLHQGPPSSQKEKQLFLGLQPQ
jgi:hypothetical protein